VAAPLTRFQAGAFLVADSSWISSAWEYLVSAVSRTGATVWRMPSMVDADPSPQVKPSAPLRSMLSLVNLSALSRSNPSTEALERTDAEFAIGFAVCGDAIRLSPLVVRPPRIAWGEVKNPDY
jgi:hypothetical protein